MRNEHPSSFKEILDAKGELLHETRVNFNRHRRSWTKIDELSPELLKEIVTLEDKRFYTHPGFDLLALFAALKEYPDRGASTMTMQLSGILNGNRGKRGLRSKFTQIRQALELEVTWTKNEILEAWLNLVAFKRDLVGIRAASFAIFGKDPRGLNSSERFLLFAQIPSPNQSRQKILNRACRYAKALNNNCEELSATLDSASFDHPQTELLQMHAPHLAQRLSKVLKDKVITTIDKKLQLEATHILRSHLRHLRVQNVQDGALLVIERKSGDVKAYVGSSGDFSGASLVDHIQSRRQAGSTLKPLLYAAAFSEKLITMTTPLKDEPFTITREGMTYQPENYQKGFTYLDVPAKVALGSSLNIPAIRVIDYLTPERFYNLLSELEFRDLQDADYYGHSMALGSVDVTLWDLVRSYRAMADGKLLEPRFYPTTQKLKSIDVFSPQVSFIMGQILSEKNNRYLTFGIQSALSTESWSAVKTGTSKDMRDNWCIGYTDKYVVGVWVGNSTGEPMWNVTGISGAAPVFSQIVSELHRDKPSSAPISPDSLVQIGEDFYLSGTEPKGKQDLTILKSSVAKILFPQNGSQFAFDPEIPEANQKIIFQASGQKLKWHLNNSEVAAEYAPDKAGKYHLKLLDERNQVKDEITFFVKNGKTKL